MENEVYNTIVRCYEGEPLRRSQAIWFIGFVKCEYKLVRNGLLRKMIIDGEICYEPILKNNGDGLPKFGKL